MELYVTLDFTHGSAVKNPPVMQEMWVQSLGQEDPLEESMANHSSMFALRIPWAEEPGVATVHRVAKSWTIKLDKELDN